MSDLSLVLTSGDPAGIGPEVIEGWLAANPEVRVAVAGHPLWLKSLAERFPIEPLPVGEGETLPLPGTPTESGARIAWRAMERAADWVGEQSGRAVVTGPVSKAWLQRVGYPFPGQTEFFADRWGGDPVMAFGGERLRVVLTTWHIPLSAVPAALNPDLLRRTVLAAFELGRAGGTAHPRIAVCGLNPHAGEEGLLGTEERDQIDPWLRALQTEFPGLSLTLPGDTVFWRQLKGEFDVVIALYHDQGLAPLKTVEFDSAANLTLGLPFIRTSPDHGTAFGIAGQGKASISSFDSAVRWAERLVASRSHSGVDTQL